MNSGPFSESVIEPYERDWTSGHEGRTRRRKETSRSDVSVSAAHSRVINAAIS